MQLILLVIHLVVCICLIGLVLLQRSEGGALGMGGGGGALMSGRGAADALARMTQFAGAFFLVTSLLLTVTSGAATPRGGSSVLDLINRHPAPVSAPATSTPAPAQSTPVEPTRPDPTESSAPQAATTQLANALGPSQAAAATPPRTTPAAPPATAAAAHAQPLSQPQRATTVPASTTQRASVPPPSTGSTRSTTTAATNPGASPQRSGTATTQRANTPANTANANTGSRLVIPNTSGGGGAALTLPAEALNPESSDGAVTPVRRERAGPDQ